MKRLAIVTFLLCILPLANSLTLGPRSNDTIYIGCDSWRTVIIETNGPDIIAISNRDQVGTGNWISFTCTGGGGHIIELINDNDISAEVVYYTRISNFTIVIIVCACIALVVLVIGGIIMITYTCEKERILCFSK